MLHDYGGVHHPSTNVSGGAVQKTESSTHACSPVGPYL